MQTRFRMQWMKWRKRNRKHRKIQRQRKRRCSTGLRRLFPFYRMEELDDYSEVLYMDDPAMIAALLEVYNSDSFQAKPEFQNGGDWLACFLILHHADYPFLQYEIECRYLPEQEVSYCGNHQLEWFVLPAGWCGVILEHDFPARDG